jgi:hypothetical protein
VPVPEILESFFGTNRDLVVVPKILEIVIGITHRFSVVVPEFCVYNVF